MRFAEITPWRDTMENSIVSGFFHFWMYASDRRDAGRKICEDRCFFFFFFLSVSVLNQGQIVTISVNKIVKLRA